LNDESARADAEVLEYEGLEIRTVTEHPDMRPEFARYEDEDNRSKLHF